jgi:anti-anti-sigma factor
MAVATEVPGVVDRRLTIGVRPGSGELVLVVAGDLDLASAPGLAAALAGQRGGPGTRVVLDLGGVGFMDASALGCILRAEHRLAGRGGALAVRRPSIAARRLLDLCDLGDLLR